ncbi:MAG: ATP-dependent Clp protease ATP-binding subunit [Kiritimatiellae bacterium]|nr:ATP-dependent Clp protease ATP-binding subunit [Kiritimatiellia bacterium]
MKFTKNATDVLNGAMSCAKQLGHDHVGTEHIFMAMLVLPECQGAKRLVKLGHSLKELYETMRMMVSGDSAPLMQRGELPLSVRTRKVLEIAAAEAGKDAPVGTEHLLVAILREGENAAAQLMFNAGIGVKDVIAAGAQTSSGPADGKGQPADSQEGEGEDEEGEEDSDDQKESDTPMVNSFGRDLTALARDGKLDPIIGRDKELRRVMQILSRRTKNNAVLIGEAGVGKTAIAEGLALQIASGNVPERMMKKRVVALDMARVVAGTQYRGQFEERLKRIIDETKRAGNIILFLDEIHTMVGAGGAEGAMDAANILKPALARGELQCVGATTMREYHKSIERDAALERRFQSVQVDEPGIADTVDVLKGIAPKYEEHHSVKFSEKALRAAVELTARYLPARQLPDKAIDAIDETGSRLRMAASARPKHLVKLQQALDDLRASKDAAVAANDFDEASRFREKLRKKGEEFADALKAWKEKNEEDVIDVTPDDIAATVSSMSGVPLDKMNATTAEKLLGMEKSLGEVVIGQDEAIKAVSRALRRSRALLSDPKRPIGSFLFLGPTGVGKTYLAKMLADRVYGDEKALIRLDMSEYQEKYSASRLVGAPPGYVGYDEGGQLTEKVRRRPYSVILFDEFEKANADICNMLLQILDDGRLTDGQGRAIDFRNTIIICTANLGFDFAREGRKLGFSTEDASTSHEALKEKLLSECKRTFRPELLNRFDEMVVFRKLGREQIGSILKLELSRLSERLKNTGISLTLEKDAEDFLAEKGLDTALGARPLRRVIQDYVEDPLAELVLAGKTKRRMRVKLAKDGKTLSIE